MIVKYERKFKESRTLQEKEFGIFFRERCFPLLYFGKFLVYTGKKKLVIYDKELDYLISLLCEFEIRML